MKVSKVVRYKVTRKIIAKAYGRSCVANRHYCLKYHKGKITYTIKGTLGIMVFERKIDAENFINKGVSVEYRYNLKIIRVNPIGRGKRPKLICGCPSEGSLSNYYTHSVGAITKKAPMGTMCYPAVKVLD